MISRQESYAGFKYGYTVCEKDAAGYLVSALITLDLGEAIEERRYTLKEITFPSLDEAEKVIKFFVQSAIDGLKK